LSIYLRGTSLILRLNLSRTEVQEDMEQPILWKPSFTSTLH
jgi:hypothetical protein